MLGAFLNWWREELASCLPEGMRRIWNGHPRPVTLRLDAGLDAIARQRGTVTLPYIGAPKLDTPDPLDQGTRSPRTADVIRPASVALERRIP